MKKPAGTLRGLHLHLDPVSGIAGDMTVAALVDAGVPEAVVSDAIAAMGVPGLSVRFETRRRGAFVGRGFVVEEPPSRPEIKVRSKRPRTKAPPPSVPAHTHEHEHEHEHEHAHHHAHRHAPAPAAAHAHRDYAAIRRLLERAKLDPDARSLAEEIFARLAAVEAALHGSAVDRVTFHEVGAFDSIADIVGMSAAVVWLAPASIGSSPPVVGSGTVRTAHGIVPVPAPATAALLQGLPMIVDGSGELTTPTGAAFLATVVDSFGLPPPQRLMAVGYGAGTRSLPDRANLLRVMLGEPIGRSLPSPEDSVLMLETNLDDMTGQLLSALCDALFKAGALDVWSTPIFMKKGRPAQKISALVQADERAAVESAFFLNSTTLGLRIYPVSRRVLSRSTTQVTTAYGPVAIKMASLDGSTIGGMPEYEDCRRLASASRVPIRQVWTAAFAASARLIESAGAPAAISSKPRLPGARQVAGRGPRRRKR